MEKGLVRAGWEAGGGGRFPCGVRSCATPAHTFGDLSRLQRLVSSCLFRDAEGCREEQVVLSCRLLFF